MKRIGLLSDTHGFVDERLYTFFETCDEIWHAGDIGSFEVIDKLKNFKPFIAVYGNIDDFNVRSTYPKVQSFECEGMKILMTHIGGYPGNYAQGVPFLINEFKPTIFIAGHSHILKVINDKKYQLLHINPGAAGNSGFHNVKTAVRFTIESAKVTSMDVWEMPRK
jgi:putative phosphoesterase